MSETQEKHNTLKTEYTVAATIVTLAGLLGMAAWMSQGNTLLWSYIETGLAWCF